MNYHRLSRALFACAFFVLLIYLVIEIVWMPIVQADAIKGFVSLNNALAGKGENFQYRLDPSGVMYKQFYAWHAPGQYLVPYILGKPFHNIGYGVILSEYIALMAGSICYIRLLRKFGIPDVVIALSMLLLFLQRFFHGVLLVYKTADVWLFFLVPALLLAQIAYHREQRRVGASCKYLLLIVGVHALGLFIKNSYALFAGFAAVFLFYTELKREAGAVMLRPRRLAYHAIPGLILSLMLVGVYLAFYSRGATPLMTVSRPPDPGWANILLYPIITVFNAPFGFNGLLHRLPFLSANDLANGVFSVKALFVGCVMICPVVMVLFNVWERREFPDEWKKLAVAMVSFYCCAWAYFVYSGADISNEDRLMFPAVMILVPMLVFAMLKLRTGRVVVGYFTVSILFSAVALYSLKGQYDVATPVNRTDAFTYFLVSENNSRARELAVMRRVLAGVRNDVLLVVKSPEEFFTTGLALPVITSEYDHYGKMTEIVSMNHRFLLAEGYRRVYFVVPAEYCRREIPAGMRLIATKMPSYKLLCFDL